jgi:hypothetical protein
MAEEVPCDKMNGTDDENVLWEENHGENVSPSDCVLALSN